MLKVKTWCPALDFACSYLIFGRVLRKFCLLLVCPSPSATVVHKLQAVVNSLYIISLVPYTSTYQKGIGYYLLRPTYGILHSPKILTKIGAAENLRRKASRTFFLHFYETYNNSQNI